jgi:hypothetical protein
MIGTVSQFVFISPQEINYNPEGIPAETGLMPAATTLTGWCG